MAATEKSVPLGLTREDVDALRSAVKYTLEHEAKTPTHQRKRVRLYRLDRRLYRAGLHLEK